MTVTCAVVDRGSSEDSLQSESADRQHQQAGEDSFHLVVQGFHLFRARCLLINCETGENLVLPILPVFHAIVRRKQ